MQGNRVGGFSRYLRGAWLVSRGAIREPIARLENWLQHKAEWLVGVLALALGAYLLYEGLHGLDVMRSP